MRWVHGPQASKPRTAMPALGLDRAAGARRRRLPLSRCGDCDAMTMNAACLPSVAAGRLSRATACACGRGRTASGGATPMQQPRQAAQVHGARRARRIPRRRRHCPRASGACRPATTATCATARSTPINTDQREESACRDHPVDRRDRGHEGQPLVVRQHDVRRHAVPEQPHRGRSDQAGRRDEVDLRAASRSARCRHRLLRRRQPRRVATPTARSSTACSTRTSWRSTRRPARRCGARKVGDINIGETFTVAPLVVKDKVIVGNSGGELGVRG